MQHLPIHPRTGLRAVYVSPKTGRAFWPIAGGSEDLAPVTDPAPAPTVDPAPSPDPAPVADPKVDPAPTGAAIDWKKRAEEAESRAEAFKEIARKHEKRQLEALGFDPETAEKIRKEQKANAGQSTTLDALKERIDALEKSTTDARAEADRASAALRHEIPEEYRDLLDGLTGDALEAKAAKVAALVKANKKLPAAPSTDGAGKVGDPVSGPKQIATREEYAALSPEERRAARKDGRLDQLLGVSK